MPLRLYGSIPHLPGSRVAADKTISAAQARRCLSAGREGDEVLVQEKLDGSCVAIVRANGRLEARGREGGLAAESRNDARRMFAAWVAENEARIDPVVGEGEVLVGEWLALVHGTRYELTHEPFVVFDLLRDRERLTVDALASRLMPAGLCMPAIVHRGAPITIDAACMLLGQHGRHGALDPPEGLVYRVEHAERVALVAKWVRPDKIDGAYLPENTGRDALYHWSPR
jgi:RNA ligase